MRILGKEEKSIGVYVHIPFCRKRCPYCDFATTAPCTLPEERYLKCLLEELAAVPEREDFRDGPPLLESLYIGGGTPSLLQPRAVGDLVDHVKRRFKKISSHIETTLEVNPDSADPERLRAFGRAGVNRLSIGIQSLNDRELKALGRLHSAERAVQAFLDARRAGFENIGVDLIFGIPGQRPKDWTETLSKIIELAPEHISIYGLTIEQGTPFHKSFVDGRIALPPEDDVVEMYERGVELLKKAGYLHYEISNLCQPGFESRHNMRYWKGGDYIGLGACAHSYSSKPGWGRRWWNIESPERYMAVIEGKGTAVAGKEELTVEEAMKEKIFLSLRMLKEGLRSKDFKGRFRRAPEEVFDARRFVEAGLLERKGDCFLLSPRGVLLSDLVFSG